MFLRAKKHYLGYPAGYAPGVDPGHVALQGATLRMSTIMTKGNHVDLSRGAQIGAFTGTPTAVTSDSIGPMLKFAAGTTQATRFANKAAVTDAIFTSAAIFVADVT